LNEFTGARQENQARTHAILVGAALLAAGCDTLGRILLQMFKHFDNQVPDTFPPSRDKKMYRVTITSVHNMHMYEFRAAKYQPQTHRACPQKMGRGDMRIHVSLARAVICCSQLIPLLLFEFGDHC
jgi:hypothetical protein